MKYYLVNYIILIDRTITENESVGVALEIFPDIDDFKQSIATLRNEPSKMDNIIIKTYKQISEEAFNALGVGVMSDE